MIDDLHRRRDHATDEVGIVVDHNTAGGNRDGTKVDGLERKVVQLTIGRTCFPASLHNHGNQRRFSLSIADRDDLESESIQCFARGIDPIKRYDRRIVRVGRIKRGHRRGVGVVEGNTQ